MGGGEMQLIAPASSAEAAQMEFIVGSPQMSFFKSVFKRHRNFAMEHIRESFQSKPELGYTSRNRFTCTFSGRRADALKEVYFSFKLPDIYSDGNLRFRWVDNVANYMIYRASIVLDNGRSIDDIYGEYIDVWNAMSMSGGKQTAYNRLSGNDPALYSPLRKRQRVRMRNNRLEYQTYPASTISSGIPSIPGRRYFMPLPFWFTRNSNLVLPLCALKLQTISIHVECRSVDELFQVYDAEAQEYVSPTTYNQRGREREGDDFRPISIADFLANGASTIDIDAYLECQYIYLDREERMEMTLAHHKMLVEQVFRFEQTGVTNLAVINLQLNNPVKELVWFTRRSDAAARNEWSTFVERDGSHILRSGKIVWNKNYERIEEKPAEFFEYLQPYEHHSGAGRAGIYSYSFALFPEKLAPTGVYNTGIITANQLVVSVNPPTESGVDYDIVVYARAYNVFEAMSGIGHLKFTP